MLLTEFPPPPRQVFVVIAEAYEILSDPDKRARYDRGEDVLSNNPGANQQQGFHGFHGFPGGGGHFHFRAG